MSNKHAKAIYWSLLSYMDWNIYIAAASEGLCFVGSQNGSFEELNNWISTHHQNAILIPDDDRMLSYRRELIYYFQGELNSFTVPFKLQGTAFQEAVWHALCEIPYGETRTYSEIAEQINKPTAVRAVGAAIGANPILITVPCHRVVGKNGALTGYRGGLEMKTKLLQLEGLDFEKSSV